MLNRIRPRNRKQWILGGLAGVLGACAFCGLVSSILPGSPPEPEPPSAVLSDSRSSIVDGIDTPIVQPTARATLPPVTPTATLEPPTATAVVVVATTAAPPPTEQPTPTPPPADTDTPVPTGPIVAKQANLRAGPGSSYAIAGSATPNTPLEIVGTNQSGDWYQLATGAWIAAFLVANAPAAGLPVVVAPTLPPAPPTATSAPANPTAIPAPAGPATIGDVRLSVRLNSSTFEIIAIRNAGAGSIDISGWVLNGSKGDDRCIMPGGTVLQPGQTFQVATGDSQPTGTGYKCGDKPIWSNDGEVIYLNSPDGQRIQINT